MMPHDNATSTNQVEVEDESLNFLRSASLFTKASYDKSPFGFLYTTRSR
jgi:hypothetical protein